jgi:two-component system, chemotaxis family, CheB/CheR fusion protein
VLFDLGLLRGDEPEILKQIWSQVSCTATVALFESEADITRLKAIDLGSQNYLSKHELSPRLLEMTLHYAIKHKQCEKMSREAAGRLQCIIESIKDFAIFSIDLNGYIDFWNTGAEHVFGYAEHEIIGQHFEILFTAEDRALEIPAQEMREAVQKAFADDERWHVKKDGTQFYASGMTHPLYDESQRLVGFTKVARNLTERRVALEKQEYILQRALEARIQAERASSLKEEFLGLIAHEMRTPLASIVGFASMMTSKSMTWPSETMTEYAGVIEEEAQRLNSLIEQLLDHARQQTGTLSVDLQVTSLERIVQPLMPQLQVLTKQHRLDIDIPPDLPSITADPQRMGQVLTNLIGNAVRYSAPGTQIILQAQQRGPAVQIDVIDEGRGIPPEQRDKVFEPFHQVDRSSTKGLGLGLALCKNLVEQHDGDIWVQDHVGPGTIISFTLPIPRDQSLGEKHDFRQIR